MLIKRKKLFICAIMVIAMIFSAVNVMLPANLRSLEAAQKKITLRVGKTKTLSAPKKVKWTSSNKKIVAIKSSSSKKAVILAKKAGSATVTAKGSGYKKVYKVVVKSNYDTDESDSYSESELVSTDESFTSSPYDSDGVRRETKYLMLGEAAYVSYNDLNLVKGYGVKAENREDYGSTLYADGFDSKTIFEGHDESGHELELTVITSLFPFVIPDKYNITGSSHIDDLCLDCYESGHDGFLMSHLENLALHPEDGDSAIKIHEDGSPTKVYISFGNLLINDDKGVADYLDSINYKVSFTSEDESLFTVKLDDEYGIYPVITPKKIGSGILHMTLEADPVIRTDFYNGKYHISYDRDYPIGVFYDKEAQNTKVNIEKAQEMIRDGIASDYFTSPLAKEETSDCSPDVEMWSSGGMNNKLFPIGDDRYYSSSEGGIYTACMSWVNNICANIVYKGLVGYRYKSYEKTVDEIDELRVGDVITVDDHQMMVYEVADNGRTAYLVDNQAYAPGTPKFVETGDLKYLAKVSLDDPEHKVYEYSYHNDDSALVGRVHLLEITSRLLF